jgi:hypothetical protein
MRLIFDLPIATLVHHRPAPAGLDRIGESKILKAFKHRILYSSIPQTSHSPWLWIYSFQGKLCSKSLPQTDKVDNFAQSGFNAYNIPQFMGTRIR